MIRVVVQHEPIDLTAAYGWLEGGEDAVGPGTGAGAVASFTGYVRADDGVEQLELEHYPGMTEATLTRLAAEAVSRWSLYRAIIVHRVGPMLPGERIVFVGTAAPHRGDALAACGALIDRLKVDAPFWKRERTPAGARWVAHRAADAAAARRWD